MICENPNCSTLYCKGCEAPTPRSLSTIALEIRMDWKKVNLVQSLIWMHDYAWQHT